MNTPAGEVTITHWHAHVYYAAETLALAVQVCEQAVADLPVEQGRMHQKPVGPHPCWSCQLSFAPGDLGQVLTWLTLHRQGLTVFVHPNTGNDLIDHRDRPVWLGASVTLNLGMFESRA